MPPLRVMRVIRNLKMASGLFIWTWQVITDMMRIPGKDGSNLVTCNYLIQIIREVNLTFYHYPMQLVLENIDKAPIDAALAARLKGEVRFYQGL